MKRLTLSYILLLVVATLSATSPKHEVRAAWVATIGGIDWPSRYARGAQAAEEQRRELCRMLDGLQRAGINTVLLQTRVRATVIYPSALEPWDGCLSGRPGTSPGYDALRLAVDECHRRGMELHAWVVTIPIGKWQSYGCQQLRRRYPSLVRRIGDEGYLNPEASGTADYLADICGEIAATYDVDGVHLDYIRYPETWRGRKSAAAITRIVSHVSQRVKALKPWVKMSCAPIGKYDDLSRYSSRGWNARRTVAQEAQEWLRQGWMDQLYPMMYFQGNNFYPFAIDWQEHAYGRTVVAGLGTYQLLPSERNWPLEEVERQMSVARQLGLGYCHFRARFLLDDVKGVLRLTEQMNRYPALTPPLTWAQSLEPLPPAQLTVSRTAAGDLLAWSGAFDCSDGDYLTYNVYASTRTPVDTDDAAHLVAARLSGESLLVPRPAGSRPLYYAVRAMDRYGNESAATGEPARDRTNTIKHTPRPPHWTRHLVVTPQHPPLAD